MAKKKIAAPAAPAGERRMIGIGTIEGNPWNGHRKADDDLIASVREHGILQNLVVRTLDGQPDRYQLISGARRFSAAAALGLAEVPCLVVELDDRAAREVTIIENLQREDLHPVDEAKAIETLISDGHSKEEVAARIGKSVAFVTRRARLSALSPRVVELAGADIGRMSVRALELLATLPEARQVDLFEGWGGIHAEADEIARQIAEESGAIAGAAFDCADPSLFPEAGPCAACLKRTGAEPSLFEDFGEIGHDDHCLDGACFQRKLEVHMRRREGEMRSKHGEKLVLVASSIPYGEAGSELRKRGVKELAPSWRETGWKLCKKSEKGALPAFVAAGKGAGEAVWVKQGVAPGGDATTDTRGTPRPSIGQRRQAYVAEKLRKHLDDSKLPAERWLTPSSMAAIAAAFGSHPHMGDGLEFWLGSDSHTASVNLRIWEGAKTALNSFIAVSRVSDLDEDFSRRLDAVADLVGVDIGEIRVEAVTAIPDKRGAA